jgi:S1-C subfamily serine protease
MSARQGTHRVVLALLLHVGICEVAVPQPSARSLFRTGEDALRAGDYDQAIDLLVQAVQANPANQKYQEVLESAKTEGATFAARSGFSLPPQDLEARLRFLVQGHARSPSNVDVLRLRQEVEAEVERRRLLFRQALSLAQLGSTEQAESLSAGLHSPSLRLPEIEQLAAEMTFQRLLQEGRLAIDKDPLGDFAQGVVEQLVLTRPDHVETLRLQRQLGERYLLVGEAALAEEPPSLANLLRARTLADRAGDHCPFCTNLHQIQSRVVEHFDAAARDLLASYEDLPDPAGQWAAHSIGAHLREALSEASVAPLTSAAPWRGWTVGLRYEGSPDCEPTQLDEAVSSALPPGATTRLLRPGESLAALDFVIRLFRVECGLSTVQERRTELGSSMYLAGQQQVSNPRYVELQAALQSAYSQLAAAQRNLQINPTNYAASGAVIGIQFRIGSLQRQLNNTAPFDDRAIELPYQYERYESAIVVHARGTIELVDSKSGAPFASRDLESFDESASWGTRGAVETDSRGIRNHAPNFPDSPDSLVTRVASDFRTSMIAAISELSPHWFVLRASQALSDGQPAVAVAFLQLLVGYPRVASGDDLAVLQEALAEVQLLPLEVAISRLPSLSSFAIDLQHGTAGEPFGRSSTDMLEGALAAIAAVRRGDSAGTGFFVNSSGLLLTNHHVLDGTGPIEVKTASEDVFLGRLVAASEEHDLALVQIPAQSPATLKLQPGLSVRLGEEVFAIGNPFGLEHTITKGIVSALRRLSGVHVIQIDAAINPGNSGGPLLLSDGTVIGVNSFGLRKDLAEGLNFAVAIDEALRVFGPSLGTP